MDINKYRLFADVAVTQNFTKTADRCGYTQPGVSQILKSLEEEIGFPLFIRTRSGVHLTPNGEAILPYVRRLLYEDELLSQEISSLKGLNTGHLTIACFASISRMMIPNVIHDYQTDYPGIQIELLEGGTDEIVKWVEDGAADFGILSRRHTQSLHFESLMADPLVAIMPRESPWTEMDSLKVDLLSGKPFILSAEGTDYDIHNMLQETKIHPDIRFTSKDDHAIVSMVASHLGFSILPRLVVEDVAYMIRMLPLSPSYERDLGFAYRDEGALTPAARHFLDTLKENVKRHRNTRP